MLENIKAISKCKGGFVYSCLYGSSNTVTVGVGVGGVIIELQIVMLRSLLWWLLIKLRGIVKLINMLHSLQYLAWRNASFFFFWCVVFCLQFDKISKSIRSSLLSIIALEVQCICMHMYSESIPFIFSSLSFSFRYLFRYFWFSLFNDIYLFTVRGFCCFLRVLFIMLVVVWYSYIIIVTNAGSI